MVKVVLLYLCLSLVQESLYASITVTDDAGQVLQLDQPARRIVSLAPHITELLFAAGAGASIVGVSGFSDYPPAARLIQRTGSGANLDLEKIVALRPDLVIAWQSGNPAGQVKQLRDLGLTVFVSEPRTLGDIEKTLARLGELAATQPQAQATIDSFNRRLLVLRQHNAGKEPVTVFYQVWDRPLMTVNDAHIISDVIRLCGGVNVFAGLNTLAPQVGIESVLQRDPQVIIAAAGDAGDVDVPGDWQRWSFLSAVRNGHLYTIPGDVLVRHTPRILDGAELMCRILNRVRIETL
jgi:iron complex transport system substrate-binding protein